MSLPMHRQQARKKFWVIGFVLVALIIAGSVYAVRTLQPTHQANNHPKIAPPIAKVQATPTSLTSKTLFMGDVFWGRYMNDWAQASSLKTAYPFSSLHLFNRAQYDAWVADLECPSVPGVHMTSAEEEATLTFNCDPSYLSEAAKWFTIFSNANNHSDNQGGQTGLDITRTQLDKYHIQYFGHFDPEKLHDVCEVVSLPVRVTMSDTHIQHGNLPVAMCGYHGVFKIPSSDSLAVMNAYSKLMPVIAYPHSGQEYTASPDQIKTTLYRSMIDNGADVVLGDHPHWVQPTESYKGHLIVYSLNNFMFDQQDTLEVTRAGSISLTLSSSKTQDVALLRDWLKLGDMCKQFHDSCLASAEKQQLKKLDLTWQFSVVASRDDGHLPRPATTSEAAAIRDRMRWQSTTSLLQPPYSGL
jgi:hypothetical protein